MEFVNDDDAPFPVSIHSTYCDIWVYTPEKSGLAHPSPKGSAHDTIPTNLSLATIGPPLSPLHESFPYIFKSKVDEIIPHKRKIIATGLAAQNIVNGLKYTSGRPATSFRQSVSAFAMTSTCWRIIGTSSG